MGIVGGPNRSSYEQLIAKDAFLHVQDFESTNSSTFAGLRRLANEVNRLLGDDQAYNKFFVWRDRGPPYPFRFGDEEDYGNSGFCKACYMAKNPEKFENVYENFNAWWHDQMFNLVFSDI